MGDERKIQFSSFPDLDELDNAKAMDTINSFYDKASKMSAGSPSLSVHYKERRSSGLRKMHVLQVRFSAPGLSARAEESGWSFLSVLQKSLKALKREIDSKTDRAKKK